MAAANLKQASGLSRNISANTVCMITRSKREILGRTRLGQGSSSCHIIVEEIAIHLDFLDWIVILQGTSDWKLEAQLSDTGRIETSMIFGTKEIPRNPGLPLDHADILRLLCGHRGTLA